MDTAWFDEMDTKLGTCFPIYVVVFVFLKVSSWTPIDSKPNSTKCLKSFRWLVCLKPNDPAFQKEIFGFDLRSSDRSFLLLHRT